MMSKAFFILLLALCALVAVVQARPIVYVARMTAANIGATNDYYGVGLSYVTINKGRLNHRLRILAGHNIDGDDTVTGAWLAFSNGTQIAELGISPSSEQGHYVYGDVRVNLTIYDHLLSSDLYVIIYSENSPDGAIGGALRARPNTGICFPTAAQAGTSSTATGIGYTHIADSANLPLDLVQQTDLLLNNSTFTALVITNVSSVTATTFNGPANSTSTAPALATLAALATDGAYGVSDLQPVTNDFFTQQLGLTYIAVATAASPNGDIRCQVQPTLGRTRRIVPESVTTVNGETNTQSGFRTLRFANQQDRENNRGAFISLAAQQTGGTGNFTYQAFYYFPSTVSRRNFDNARGFSLEINARQFGDATWNFDYFDATTGEHVPTATFSSPGLWTPGFANYFHHDVHTFTTGAKELIVRVTANSPTSSTLWLDLFAVRTYEPLSLTNQDVRTAILTASLYPTVLGSDD